MNDKLDQLDNKKKLKISMDSKLKRLSPIVRYTHKFEYIIGLSGYHLFLHA